MWKSIVLGLVAVAVFGGGIAWLLGWFSEDPRLVEVRELQAKVADTKTSDAERVGLLESLRTKVEALPESSRQAVFESGMRSFQRQFDARVDQLLVMSPAERTKALDEAIDRFERMRAQFGQRPAGGPPAGAPPFGFGFRGQNLTDAQRIDFTRSMLTRTTPEGRAKMQEYFRMLSERMKQRGIQPPGPPGGRS